MRTTILRAAMVATFGLAAFPAFAQDAADWVETDRHEVGRVFYDRASLQRDGGMVTVSGRTILDQAQPDGTTVMIGRFKYDCVARTVDLLSFSMIRADGSVVFEAEVPADQRLVEQIAGNSPNSLISDAVCSA